MYLYDEKRNDWIAHRRTGEYQRRRRRVRDAWIVVGVAMLYLPLGAQIILGLFATFLSFAFLDEAPYRGSDARDTD